MSFFDELKRRNVVRVGIAYAVATWILLQLTDVVAEILKLPEWAPKLILLILVIGFIPALIFAWAFEMTPEGIKREKDIDRSDSITPTTGKKLNNAIVILLTLAVAYLLFDKFSKPVPDPIPAPANEVAENSTSGKPNPALAIKAEATPIPKRQSIAVLPFDNRSDQKSDAYFVEGIHDDLLTKLARIGSLKVISRTSVGKYKDTQKTIPEIAAELGVATIMEGAVQRAGNAVRINVQLIDSATDEHLWAEIYDRELTAQNLFAIQSEISRAIADALEATLSSEEHQRINTVPTLNLAAYDAYLRGRQLMATRDTVKLKLASEEFARAVELDPQFALAWVGVADSNNLLSVYGTLSYDLSMPTREAAIMRALAIDDKLGEAYASLGNFYGRQNQPEKAEAAYQQAIQLSPGYATAWHWYANFLAVYPLRSDETINLAFKAAELDPRSSIIGSMLGHAYGNRGLYSMAERQFQKVLDLDPAFSQAVQGLARLYIFNLGRFDKGVEYARRAVQMDPGNIGNLAILANTYQGMGDHESAQVTLAEMERLDANNPWTAFATVILSASRDQPAGTTETINWVLPKLKYIPFLAVVMANTELGLGHQQRARDIYLSITPGWLQPAEWQQLIGRYPRHACTVAWLLRDTGDEQLGNDLLVQATAYHDEVLPAVIEHADIYTPEICYLSAGNTEKALASLETQLAHNHLFGWDLNHRLPMYDLIRTEPRYQAVIAERKRRIAIQRKAVAQMNKEATP